MTKFAEIQSTHTNASQNTWIPQPVVLATAEVQSLEPCARCSGYVTTIYHVGRCPFGVVEVTCPHCGDEHQCESAAGLARAIECALSPAPSRSAR